MLALIFLGTALGGGFREHRRVTFEDSSEAEAMLGEGDAIYIPSAGLRCAVVEADFTQAAVDSYDVVYSEGAYGGESGQERGQRNPFVMGHRTGSMGVLHKTDIGGLIYLRINGRFEVYRVFVSEAACVYGSRSIVGAVTGAELTHCYETKTLHLYTCYPPAGQGGRWIVLAELTDMEMAGSKIQKPLTFYVPGRYNQVNK